MARIPPALLPQALTREQLVDEETRVLLDEVQQSFDAALVQAGDGRWIARSPTR